MCDADPSQAVITSQTEKYMKERLPEFHCASYLGN